MVAGADVAFLNKNCHVELDFRKIEFYTIIFFLFFLFLKVELNNTSIKFFTN